MRTFNKRYDSSIPSWNKDAEFNKIFLQSQKVYINDFYNRVGYVFLKDLYGILGLPITKESCTYGWYKGVLKEEDFVKFNFSQIKGTSDFELTFECYPIVNYLPEEELKV